MGFFKDLGAAFANPIGFGLDLGGIGPQAGFDYLSGKGQSEDALAAAQAANQAQRDIANQNIALQREFAQMGIRWRVDDARAAGIHPLAALGASGASFNPIQPLLQELPSENSWKHQMGQNLRGMLMNKLDPTSRVMNNLSLERAGLENDLLRVQIANQSAGQGGAIDPYLTGQPNSLDGNPMVVDVPLRRVASDPVDPSKEVGALNDWQMVRTKDGYAVVPAQGVKQAIEDSPMEYQWLARAALRTYTLPDGRQARMNPVTGNLVPVEEVGPKLWQGFKNFMFKSQYPKKYQ